MGLFSRFVLGIPFLLQTSTTTFHTTPQNHQSPDGGNRTSLRFMPTARYTLKRRRPLKNGKAIEEEVYVIQDCYKDPHFDFIGEVIEQELEDFKVPPKLANP